MIRNLVLSLITAAFAFAGARDEQWKKVHAAIGQGLLKTAIVELEPIIQGAMRDKAHGGAISTVYSVELT